MTERNEPLIDQLRDLTPERLARRVEEVDQLEPEEHERRKRASEYKSERHWKENIGPKLNWLKFAVICFIVTGICYLCGSYLIEIHDDFDKKVSLLSRIFELGLVSGTTLFIDSQFRKR